MACRDGNGVFATAADLLIESPEARDPEAYPLHMELLPRHRGVAVARQPLPDRFVRAYMPSKTWRVKDGRLSAVAAGCTLEPGALTSGHVTITPGDGPSPMTCPFSLRYGQVHLKAMKLCATWYARGQFVGDGFQASGDRVTLVHRGVGKPSRVWEMPLGEPVAHDGFYAALPRREHAPMPPLEMALQLTCVDGGFDARLTTRAAYDGIPVQLELSFEGGGLWQTAGQVTQVMPGAAAMLEAGRGVSSVAMTRSRCSCPPTARRERTTCGRCVAVSREPMCFAWW